MNNTEPEIVSFTMGHRETVGKKKPSEKAVKGDARTTIVVIRVLATLPVSKGFVPRQVSAPIRTYPHYLVERRRAGHIKPPVVVEQEKPA